MQIINSPETPELTQLTFVGAVSAWNSTPYTEQTGLKSI